MSKPAVALVAEFPAFKFVAFEGGMKAGEEFAMPFESKNYGIQYHSFKIGSVVSSSLESCRCPIQAVERALKLGHELHFAFGLGSVLHNGPKVQKVVRCFQWGEVIEFEGRKFELCKANNQNVALKEV